MWTAEWEPAKNSADRTNWGEKGFLCPHLSLFNFFYKTDIVKVTCLCKICLPLFSHCMNHFLTSGLALQVTEHFHMAAGTGPNSRHATHHSWWKIGKGFLLHIAMIQPSGLFLHNRHSLWYWVLLGKLYKCELQSNNLSYVIESGTLVKHKYVKEMWHSEC